MDNATRLRTLKSLGPADKYFDLEGAWDQWAPNPAVPSFSNRFPNKLEQSRFPEIYKTRRKSRRLGRNTRTPLRILAHARRRSGRRLKGRRICCRTISDSDPYGDITRVFGHFYDPINNDGIPDFPGNIEERVKSINWALGVDDALAPSFNPLLSRRNYFSWLDARRAYIKALTYQTANATLRLFKSWFFHRRHRER